MPFFYEEAMRTEFNIDRERHNRLFYEECVNDSCVLQFHSQIELYFVDEGEMDFVVNNHYRRLSAGEMSVALSYDSHLYKTPRYSKSSVFIIPVYMCESFIAATKSKKVAYPFITDKDTVRRIKECINEVKREGVNEIKQSGYIYVILGIIMDSVFFNNVDIAQDPELSARILYYINDNFSNDISLESVSAEFGYNKSYVSRYFKNSFGIGFNRYLSAIRLKKALTLMNERVHSLTRCAMESGFNSMRTFYRTFSDEFNCSPMEYLERSSENKSLEKIERRSGKNREPFV